MAKLSPKSILLATILGVIFIIVAVVTGIVYILVVEDDIFGYVLFGLAGMLLFIVILLLTQIGASTRFNEQLPEDL